MALACDLRIMATDALIGLTETSLAIIPGAGGCVRLPRLIGAAKAKEVILLSKKMSAGDALSCGLVNQIADKSELAKSSNALLEQLMANGPLALRAAKAAIDFSGDLAMSDALQKEAECYARIIPTSDRLEALAAFAEKRNPEFKGE